MVFDIEHPQYNYGREILYVYVSDIYDITTWMLAIFVGRNDQDGRLLIN